MILLVMVTFTAVPLSTLLNRSILNRPSDYQTMEARFAFIRFDLRTHHEQRFIQHYLADYQSKALSSRIIRPGRIGSGPG